MGCIVCLVCPTDVHECVTRARSTLSSSPIRLDFTPPSLLKSRVSGKMAPTLPPDIILLICEELGNQRAFSTLFNAALSSKQVAASALLWMYRVHTTSAIRTGENTEDELPKDGIANSTMSRWVSQWRSIILSSLGDTAYPYCLYIRALDLTNLKDLFDDLVFKRTFETGFFQGAMRVFKESREITTRRSKFNKDSVVIVDMVGESISKYVGDSAALNGGTAALEELSGEIQKHSLPKWIRRIPRLKSLTLWDALVLDGVVGDAIKENCPDFESLAVYYGLGPEADADLSSFFMRLRPNSLRSWKVHSHHDCGPHTFLSLNNHHASLKTLSLGNLQGHSLSSLYLLKGCTAIESLDLQDQFGRMDLRTDPEATENDVFHEVVSWLTKCKQLKNISLTNFVNGPEILTSVCLEHAIKLDSLHLAKYTLANSQEFHRALAHQTSLTSLHLKGDAEGSFRDDIETLVTCLGQLKNLKYLNILDISDYFRTTEIQLLALHLPKLEDLRVGGYDVTDEVWRGICTLPNLRSLSFHAVTSFTYTGIMTYISTLQPSNAGLQLSIMCADVTSDLSPLEIVDIRAALTAKVDGRFDFVLYREAESEFDSDSD